MIQVLYLGVDMTDAEPGGEESKELATIELSDEVVHSDAIGDTFGVEVLRARRIFFRRRSARSRLSDRLKEAIGTAPKEALAALEAIIAEGDLKSYNLRRAAAWWARAYYLLGLPAAVLATLAGATGLASTGGRIPAAIIALVAAGLGAAATFLNSDQNRKHDDDLSAAWQELADDARLYLLQFSQDLDPTRGEFVASARYWSTIIALHKRKGLLLRGDLTGLPSSDAGAAVPRTAAASSPRVTS